MTYEARDDDRGNYTSGSGTQYVIRGLGTATKDGTWQTITRDLEADLKAFQPDNHILSVNAFLIRGSGWVDDIILMGDEE
jgi:hypothetical protein